MNELPNVTEAIRKTTEAYTQALATAMSMLASAPTTAAGGNPAVEQWLRLARMTKDGLITAIEQGFVLWEREYRRILTGSATPPAPPSNPIEAWSAEWKKALDAFTTTGRPADPWSEQTRRSAEAMQAALQEGLNAWQRLWPPPRTS
jgi:hypothetical protein